MQYHKIQSVFKRDPTTRNKRFLMDQYSCVEFEYLRNLLWVGTEKVDGTNVRLYKDGRIGGRTDNAQLHAGLMNHLQGVSPRLQASDLPENIVLYGEGYGAKIQSGGQYIPDGQSFVLFDVMINGNYQPRESVVDVACKLDLPVTPIMGRMSLIDWVCSISAGEYRTSMLHIHAKNEGVVIRPEFELRTRTGDRVITKLKFKDFGTFL